MDMKLIVQKKYKLNAKRVVKFVEKYKKAKLAIVCSSVKDDAVSLNLFEQLVKNLKIPFVGTRVSGTITPKEGYSEDAVAIAVLCGDFDVRVFHESIDFEDQEKTINKIIPRLKGYDLCLTYSANYYKKNIFIDAILRRVQYKFPDLQIWGMDSAPPPIVVTNDGIYENTMVFAVINGLDFSFDLDSGFRFDENEDSEFVITRSDEYYIYEINGRNAVEEYSKIQHMRPYFINMLQNLSSRPDVVKLFKILSRLNEVLYEGIMKISMRPLGTDLNGRAAEVLFALELDEKNKKYILTQSYKPRGSVLRRLSTSPESQLAVYDRLYKRFPKEKAMLISSCAMRPFWFNFDFETLEKKLRRFKYPYLISHVFGEFGTYLPYGGMEQNVVHGGTVKALVFR